ncbi:hypothetical protein [Gaetbulibacter jejuensis]|uniref:hypothetical protein n=1 Tax=Gaetbulibacter jejuensis TaxID=584607 RepID=UPI00300B814F
MKKSTNRIWYPGSSYAPQDWIDYLTNEINGEWTFTDQTETGWDWTLNSNHQKWISCTFELLNNKRFYKVFNTLVISFHPGLKTFQEINESNISSFKPKTIIYAKELFEYGNNELNKEIPMFEEEGYSCEKIVILPKLKRIYASFILS